MYANTYVVTIYTHEKADPQHHSGQVWDVLSSSTEGFGGTAKIDGFDVFVEEPRRWTLLTHRVGLASPIHWVARLIRRGLVTR